MLMNENKNQINSIDPLKKNFTFFSLVITRVSIRRLMFLSIAKETLDKIRFLLSLQHEMRIIPSVFH